MINLTYGRYYKMNKVLLIDGNSLMFRAYYATAYTGNLMGYLVFAKEWTKPWFMYL